MARQRLSRRERAHYLAISAEVMERCDQLAQISSMPGAVCRTYLTSEHQRCNSQVAQWMQSAGMHSWQDSVGNVWGRLPSLVPDAPTLIIGSHLDTVPNAGKYDGILGVLLPLSVLSRMHHAGLEFPFNIDLVGFGDEEGSRFGTTLMGSRAVAGSWRDDWLELTDKNGVTLRSALAEFGSDESSIALADRSAENLLAYLEVHIEQGPLLEQAEQALGVVTSIAGARRLVANIRGQAGHAGTVPMELRQDALVAAAGAVQLVEQVARNYQVVATVGELHCYPGAPNVIPGDCQMTVDVRSGRDRTRDLAIEELQKRVDEMVIERGLSVEWQETHRAAAAECASGLQRMMENVLMDMGLTPMSFVSGAGHDAMSFDGVTDIGMFFVRCAGGLSHHPNESVESGDVAQSAEALTLTLNRLREMHSSAAV